MILKLFRYYTPWQTFGRLMYPDGEWTWTIERPWVNNEKYVSCIPQGGYTCRRHDSPRWGPTFLVTEVPNRTHILFHVANVAEELEGCIALCKGGPIWYKNQFGLSKSKVAMDEFFEKTDHVNEFTLLIGSAEVNKWT